MSVFNAISYYFSAYKKFIGRRVYIVFVLTVAVALTEGFGIALLLPLIEAADAGDASGQMGSVTSALNSFLEFIGIGSSTVGILLFIGVVFIAKGVLMFAEGGYLSYLQARLMVEIKGALFDAYTTMDYSYYSRRNTGHFINIINSQTSKFIESFGAFKTFLSTIIMSAVSFIAAFILAWQFALMALAIGIAMLFLFRWLNEFVRNLSREASQEATALNKFIVQSIQAFKYLASTAEMDYLKSGVFGSIERLSSNKLKRGLAGAFTGAIKEPVSVLFLLLVIILQVTVFDAPIAPIFVALILFHRGLRQVVGIQQAWQSTLNNLGSLEMVMDEFDTVTSEQEPSGNIKLRRFSDKVEFRNVFFSYNKDDGNVLQNINLEIPVNETVAFVGKSGAGKSTLIDMITLMLRPDHGEVFIDGIAGSDVMRSSWRKQLGYVAQETVVFDDTVANNISLWKGDYKNDEETRYKVHGAAERAYLLDFIMELHDGFDTVVGDRGVRLSGGQRQRLFIARELFKEPNLLILDEATSALDSDSELYIKKSIDSFRGAMTVVIIAHRLSTIRNCDHIYVLDEGKILEHGSYEELTLRTNGRFREMVEVQSL